MTDPVRIALLGRNALIREGLRHILAEEHFEVVYSAEESANLTSVDFSDSGGHLMIVIDQGSCDFAGEQLQDLQIRFPDARIVILAEAFDFDNMVAAFRAGVHGYIVKDIRCESLISSLQLVALGEKVLPGELVNRLPSAPSGLAMPTGPSRELCEILSAREIEILRCLVIGYPNKLISRRLDISEATVKVHVKAVLRKLNVHNRTQAAICALNHGIDGSSMESGFDTRPGPAPAKRHPILPALPSGVPEFLPAILSGSPPPIAVPSAVAA